MNPATALRAEAVLFFEHGALCRTMLKVEFDALLDQVVGVADFAGQMIDAAYVTILPGLVIETVVLFRIGFDDDGYADRQWDLPLEQLLHYAEPVAITDQTNLRLSSLNHCPLPWLQTHLWEPDLQREHNVLVQIHEAISRNRLGLAFADEPPDRFLPPPSHNTRTPSARPDSTRRPSNSVISRRSTLCARRISRRLTS